MSFLVLSRFVFSGHAKSEDGKTNFGFSKEILKTNYGFSEYFRGKDAKN